MQTAFTSTVQGLVFTENVKPSDEQIRNRALKHIRATERHKYQVTKICFDTAKPLGVTIV